ncbi:hypothetical protein [Microcoleus sp. B3-D7]|uniref:hypothetical protein n=1 Tax=Microcoleus sp. B3-D7 TaxID=2818659 RepID=UPI002FD160D9
MKYHRDVFVIVDGRENQVVRLQSNSEIDAYSALNAAARILPPVKPGESRHLKVYSGEES